MRRSTLSLLLALALSAGCSRPNAAPPQHATTPSQAVKAPVPKVEGVSLADLELKNAPMLDIRRTDAPPGNGPAPDLTDVTFISTTDGYAVTHEGVIARSRDGGSTWSQVYQLKGGRFSRVEAVDSQTVFAVAQTGCDPGPNCNGPQVLLRTSDGGQNWSKVEPRLPPFRFPTDMEPTRAFPWLSFQFLSARVGYAAGDKNENALMQSPPLMVTRDGGQTWAMVKLPDGLFFMGGFSFVSPDRGYVTAYRGETREYQVLATADGGTSWRTLYSTPEFGLFAVDFPTSEDGFVGGGLNPKTEQQPRQVVLATHDGGTTWSVVSRVEDRGSPVVRLRMISRHEGWVARGGCWSMGGTGPCSGPLLYTRDGGKTWTDTGHRVSRIRSSGRQAWTIDEQGATTLWGTADGGASWQQFSRPDALRVTQVQFLDPQTGFIGTNFGFYQTVDGGKSWTPHPLGGQFEQSESPLFLDREIALSLQGWELRRSTDGGRTWKKVGTPLPTGTDRISMPALTVHSSGITAAPNEAWLAMESIKCMNPDCPAFLIGSKDGGATWQELQPGPPRHLTQMAFADQLHGVGFSYGNKLMVTADGGQNWSEETAPRSLSLHYGSYAGSPADLWLTGAYSPGDSTMPSTLLHSVDGGQHWVAFIERRYMLGQIQFMSSEEGWAIGSGEGSSGLLATHDGGHTWSEVWPTLPAR